MAETRSFDTFSPLKVSLHIINLKLIISCHRNTVLKRFPFIPSWNPFWWVNHFWRSSSSWDNHPTSFSHWIYENSITTQATRGPENGRIPPIGGEIGSLSDLGSGKWQAEHLIFIEGRFGFDILGRVEMDLKVWFIIVHIKSQRQRCCTDC